MECAIKSVTTEQELDRVLAFEKLVLANSRHLNLTEYSRAAWLDRMKDYSDLMLFAEASGQVVAIVFGRLEINGNMTVGPVAVAESFRRQGLAREMMLLLEKRALDRGVQNLTLGSIEAAEEFYIKCGYRPFLFVQTGPPHKLDSLRTFGVGHHEVWSYDDGTDIRLMLETDGIDRQLQHAYDAAFPGCSTQMVFMKRI